MRRVFVFWLVCVYLMVRGRIRAMNEIARSANKVIYAPLPFFEAAHATHTLE